MAKSPSIAKVRTLLPLWLGDGNNWWSTSGKVTAAPKAAAEKAKFEENKELTKFINERNLTTIAGVAAQAGSKLKLVQAPVAATAQQKRK